MSHSSAPGPGYLQYIYIYIYISTISGQKHLDLAAAHHRRQQDSNKSNTCHLVESQSPSGAQCAVTVTLTLKHTHVKWPLYRYVIVCVCISGNRYHGSEHISRLPAASLVLAPSWAIIKCFMLPVLCVAVAGAELELVDTKLTEHYTWLVNHLLARACPASPACCCSTAEYCNLFTVATDNIHPAIVITRNIDGRKYNSDKLQQNVFTITGGPINTQARSDHSCSHYQ